MFIGELSSLACISMDSQRNNQDRYSNYNQVQKQDEDQDRNRNSVSGNSLNGYSSHDHSGDHVHLQSSCNNIGVLGLDESYNNHQFPANRIILNPQGEGPIGLRLEKSPSLIMELELSMNKGKQLETHEEQLVYDQPAAVKKLKATNILAVFLKIGSWKWVSKNQGDLVVKFYYGRKKLVWEFLYGALKKKIEIRWPQISAINSFVGEDKKGVLEIELNEQPEYSHEVRFQAGKHTLWETSGDFTEGQAWVCRRHTVVFLPGVLDEAFKKLLQCDSRLLNISRQPFPTHNSPLFCNRQILDFSNNRSIVHGSSSVPAVSNYGSSSVHVVSSYGGSSVPVVSIYGGSSVPAVSSYGGSSVHAVSSYGGSSVPAVSSYGGSSVPAVSSYGRSSVPAVSSYGSSSVPAVSSYGGSSVPAVSNYGSSSVPVVSNYESSSVPAVSSYGHQGTFQNLVEPTSSFVDNSNSNLPMPDLKFSNSDELAMRASFQKQRVDGICEQRGNSQVQEISFPPIGDQQDHLLANHREESLIPDQEIELDLTDIQIVESLISDLQPELDIHNPNEFPNIDYVDQSHVNSEVALEEHNSWKPMETRIHDSSSVGGEINHMAYVDEDLCSADHGSSFFNNRFSFMEPSSFLPSQFSIQDFNNGGNWMNEMGYTDNRNLHSYDSSGGNGELAFQNPNLGAN